jgi:hypothetical protein
MDALRDGLGTCEASSPPLLLSPPELLLLALVLPTNPFSSRGVSRGVVESREVESIEDGFRYAGGLPGVKALEKSKAPR